MSRSLLCTTAWLMAATSLGAAGLGLLGCRSGYQAIDPNEGAYHLPVMGHTDPYGQSDEVEPMVREQDSQLETRGGQYGSDVATLARVLTDRWANRDRHRELDGVSDKAVMEDLADAASQGRNDDDFARAIRDATCRLRDGHLRLPPDPPRSRPVESGLSVIVASGEFVVGDVDGDQFETGQKRPKRGDVIEEIDGRTVPEYVDEVCLVPGSTPAHRERLAAQSLMQQTRLEGDPSGPSKITIRRGKKRHTVRLTWSSASSAEPEPCVEGKMIGPAGLITIRSFACGGDDEAAGLSQFRRQLDDALGVVSGAQRLTLDVRNNPGGRDDQAKLAAARFVSGEPVWMRYRHADDETPEFRDETLPAEGSALEKPLSVLIGPGCASTCEIFVSVLANRPDTVLIGEPTAGSVGNPQPVKLERSGLEVWVPRTSYALPGTDVLIEGRGVSPQVEVRMTADDVRRRRDPALENAFKR